MLFQQLTDDGEERIEMPAEGLWYHQQKDGSLEASGERLYSLKIENTTSVDSGTYRCILEEPEGWRNQSGTVTLKVTGEVICCTCFLLARCVCTCIGSKLRPLDWSPTGSLGLCG